MPSVLVLVLILVLVLSEAVLVLVIDRGTIHRKGFGVTNHIRSPFEISVPGRQQSWFRLRARAPSPRD